MCLRDDNSDMISQQHECKHARRIVATIHTIHSMVHYVFIKLHNVQNWHHQMQIEWLMEWLVGWLITI